MHPLYPKFEAYIKAKGIPHKQAGSSLCIEDPFKSPDPRCTLHFYLESGKCVGYRSGWKGYPYQVIAKIENCSYSKAKTILGDTAAIAAHESEEKKEDDIPEMAFPVYTNPLWVLRNSPTYTQAILYLHKRGFTANDIINYKLYFCWAGDYENRIIIPYFDKGKMVYWTARDFTEEVSDTYKYLYPPRKVFQIGARDFLFNLHNQAQGQPFSLVEGQLDAMTIGAVATGGKMLTDSQLKLVLMHEPEYVILAIDDDLAGYEMLCKTSKQLDCYGIEIRYAIPEGGKDWNEIGREKSMSILNKAVLYNIIIENQLRSRYGHWR